MEPGIAPMAVPAEESGSTVGRVQGLLDSTPLLWHVAVQDGAYLQFDDVVVTVRDVPGRGLVMTSGIITEVCARHEGASFGSDVFLISDGVLPAAVQEVAEVTTTRVEPEFYVPPRPSALVRRATGDERAQALYFDQMDRKVPVGAGRDGETAISTWISSTEPAVRTFLSPASPGSRRRRRSRCSCCTPCSAGTRCVTRTMQKRSFFRSRARISCSSTSPTGV